MSQAYTAEKNKAIPIIILTNETFPIFQEGLSPHEKKWIEVWNFKAGAGEVCVLSTETGTLAKVLYGVGLKSSMWNGASLARAVPKDYTYYFENLEEEDEFFYALAWGLENYHFSTYKTHQNKQKYPSLSVSKNHLNFLASLLEVSFHVRDWINTPACDLTPENFAWIAGQLAEKYGADSQIWKGEDLKKQYPLVHVVGKASHHGPCVVDFKWGNPNHPKVTLVGKGVTFDTGGLDIKSAHNMLLMKKDMGGAAQALGLAKLIMRMELPVQLRVILPLAENSISGEAYRPSDIITSRKGITVEIGDTDAEGRLLLADALTAACEEKPDYLFDFATLTGAARIAVGTEISAFFSNDESLSRNLVAASKQAKDPLWELPLWEGYESMIKSTVADTNSCSNGGYAGAITAALFLKKFVEDDIPWAHFDLMAWNVSSKPGRPEGGEVMGLRAVYWFLRKLMNSDIER